MAKIQPPPIEDPFLENDIEKRVSQTWLEWFYKSFKTAVNTYLGLSDTPSSYIGEAGKVLIVNDEEDGLSFESLSSASVTWIELTSMWTVEPSSVSYSGGDGDVFEYTYGSTVYYRFVPTAYDPDNDAFYTTFSDPVLSGLVISRAMSIS